MPNVTYNASNANRADMSIHLSMNPQQPYDVIFYISAEAAVAAGSKDTQGRNFVSINSYLFDVLAYTLLFTRGVCTTTATTLQAMRNHSIASNCTHCTIMHGFTQASAASTTYRRSPRPLRLLNNYSTRWRGTTSTPNLSTENCTLSLRKTVHVKCWPLQQPHYTALKPNWTVSKLTPRSWPC